MGDRCLQTWPKFAQKSKLTFSNYKEQENFFYYWPGLHNVALMDLFGLIKLTTNSPDKGKGWRIKKLEALPYGQALMNLIRNGYIAVDYRWPGEADPSLPLEDLQPMIQPFFPEWQNTLTLPIIAFEAGRHIFKVSLGKVWRRIAISGEATLAELSSLILDSVEFDHDHLDQFTLKTPSGHTLEITHPAYGGGLFSHGSELQTDQVRIGSLPISEGSVMEYLFDFGDCWRFQLQLETIERTAPETSSKGFAKIRRQASSRRSAGEIIEAHGPAPEQYPDYDDEIW